MLLSYEQTYRCRTVGYYIYLQSANMYKRNTYFSNRYNLTSNRCFINYLLFVITSLSYMPNSAQGGIVM